ncbi:uncharacterized protein LOC109861465 [Pseudomyrmex gracilis]|uniref:uncharacterized protein LOC109861465 n=1 Tax=Pseudomyrmex gracilis TaxID=219809 RepID=UPI000994BF7F|nr:uncharacterized protein LOC109861465 [Pseudomyrmex gracilis]
MWLSFTNNRRKKRLLFVVYLESVLYKTDGETQQQETSYAYQYHKTFSIGFYVRCSYNDSFLVYRYRRGEDCIAWFVEELKEFANRIKIILSTNVSMETLTEEQKPAYRNASHCHVCEKSFAADDIQVRDYCHLTDRYRGPAHSNCNLNYKDSHYIPNVTQPEKSSSKSYNIELRFIDSYKFLSASLDKLASFLNKDKLKILQSEFRNLSVENFKLLTRKGVFPYEYVDFVDKLQERRLPPRESFYSSLTGETISESKYAHAVNIWQQFSISTLGEDSDLYLKTDVLLLADIFENFRESCIRSYGLDPAHYYTLLGYTWDAMLKHTGITFDLLTDVDMVMFIERGLSQCSARYAHANNKYMQMYDTSKPTSYLMYFDINNLYGWAMCQPPYDAFQWVDNVWSVDVMSVASTLDIGYILEVDLEYPRKLHDVHADLPFCPTRDKPPGNDRRSCSQHYITKRVTSFTIVPCNNVCGLCITKIHRILQFMQSQWLRSHIKLNTQFRTLAKNDFEKNVYKLMNNAVFGKTMENVRNHVDIKLLTKWDGKYGVEALISRPNFHSRSVFSENFIAVELRKLKDYMTPLYRDKCKIMYTDTDSLIYFIKCEDMYDIMKRDIVRFDTGDYPTDNVYGIPRANKKVLGLMKDENNGIIMTEFVGLRAKMYALKVDGKRDMKKTKGVKSRVVARTLTFDDYK